MLVVAGVQAERVCGCSLSQDHIRNRNRNRTSGRSRNDNLKHSRSRGSALVDASLALLICSIGMLALLKMMSASLVESAHAQYRSAASQLASMLVARMWTGDRSLASLQARYGAVGSADYQAWLREVQAHLPGTQEPDLLPMVSIDQQRRVSITLYWKLPSQRQAHQWLAHAQITD